MFCACISIIICLFILICGTTVSVIDVRRYDFGLYYSLLAIVGLTAAVAICVVRPRRGCCTRDPQWYTRCCERLNACLVAEQERVTKAYIDGHAYSTVGAEDGQEGGGERRSAHSSNISRQQRATLVMLRPAVELMQHMLHGLVTREEEERRDEEDTSEMADDQDDDPKHKRRRSKKKKKKKQLMLPASEACLYTILETSTADVTMAGHTELTSVVTVHEGSSQLLNDSVPNSPAALVPSNNTTLTPRQQLIISQRKHLLNQISTGDSPRLKALDSQIFTFQRHDVLNETVDEERISETRCSSTHEG